MRSKTTTGNQNKQFSFIYINIYNGKILNHVIKHTFQSKIFADYPKVRIFAMCFS